MVEIRLAYCCGEGVGVLLPELVVPLVLPKPGLLLTLELPPPMVELPLMVAAG
jgi:hypothetical protein